MNGNERVKVEIVRRRLLQAASLGSLGALLPMLGCGSGAAEDEGVSLAQGKSSATVATVPNTGPSGRVVVVGGGMAGAAAAKYLRMWGGSGVAVTLVERSASYTSNIMSNLVLTGQRSVDSLRYTYDNLVGRYGVSRVQGEVVAIDPVRKEVTLAAGSRLAYDRLVLAPGVVFTYDLALGGIPGLETAAAQAKVLHAWQAGPQTTALRNQITAMPRGGVFVLTIPAKPYRCPPGPYERACLVADWLKKNRPGVESDHPRRQPRHHRRGARVHRCLHERARRRDRVPPERPHRQHRRLHADGGEQRRQHHGARDQRHPAAPRRHGGHRRRAGGPGRPLGEREPAEL